ncbi:hypothetical protein [Streptomyces sp. NPDC089799]|uniref:hypothetical protein n=1 Tax=Streptomyces sp. NPDC089799 TaxID=3155066 RepID=UPI0034168211
MRPDQPPRLLAAGDVVAVYAEALGAWTASQVTGIDAEAKCAAVLELDWSGPEPATVADLGEVRPLRLTHHSWSGKLSHCNQGWVPGCTTASAPPATARPFASDHLADQMKMAARWSPAR